MPVLLFLIALALFPKAALFATDPPLIRMLGLEPLSVALLLMVVFVLFDSTIPFSMLTVAPAPVLLIAYPVLPSTLALSPLTISLAAAPLLSTAAPVLVFWTTPPDIVAVELLPFEIAALDPVALTELSPLTSSVAPEPLLEIAIPPEVTSLPSTTTLPFALPFEIAGPVLVFITLPPERTSTFLVPASPVLAMAALEPHA